MGARTGETDEDSGTSEERGASKVCGDDVGPISAGEASWMDCTTAGGDNRPGRWNPAKAATAQENCDSVAAGGDGSYTDPLGC